MKKKKSGHIAGLYYRKIKKLLRKVAVDFDIDTIHHFRITFKKLRALLRVLAECEKQKVTARVSKKLKRCYRLAGAIRDLQLQQLRVKAEVTMPSAISSAYINLLQQKIDTLKPKLAVIIEKDPVKHSKQITKSISRHPVSSKAVQKYSAKKWKDVQSIILKKSMDDKHLHRIRKMLKDLLYIQDLGPGKDRIKKNDFKLAEYENLKAVLNSLGELQDKNAAIALLKPAWLNKFNTATHHTLNQLKTSWTNEKETKRMGLIELLKNNIDKTFY